MRTAVGMIGIGQMGSQMAHYLLEAGFTVIGYDVDRPQLAALADEGGIPASSVAEVADAAPIIITSLPSLDAFDEVMDQLAGAGAAERIVIETSTLPIAVKERGRDRLAEAGLVLLDCPLSGTAAQAREKDVVVYASGPKEAVDKCGAVFEGFSRAHFHVGEFGSGSKMKFIANLLVAVHNVAAAEAMTLARMSGLDAQQTYDIIISGAGSSRMFEVRGPTMVTGNYYEAGIAGRTFGKDLDIIGAHAKSLHCPVPLFATSAQIHIAAVAQGYGDADTAAVCAVMETMAGMERT